MVKDVNGNEIVETPPAVPAVPAESAVDEHGVPWKNRSLENERKLQAAEAERDRLNQELEAARTTAPAAPAAEERQQWEIRAESLAQTVFQRERAADKAVDAKLQQMEGDTVYGEAVKLYRRQIEARVATLDLGMRTNPIAIERAVHMVIGENLASLKERYSKPVPDGVARRLTPPAEPVNTGGAGGAGSGAGRSSGDLTEEEAAFADRRGYSDEKGYSVEDIKLRYKKYMERKK